MASSDKPACKICGAAASSFGKRSLETSAGTEDVSYFKCDSCGFIFTQHFDAWSADQFATEIYNEHYVEIDPEYVESRPKIGAQVLIPVLAPHKDALSLLDYGGGNGKFAELMREAGFHAETYDQYSSFNKRPDKPSDFITSFEVIEHFCFPRDSVRDMNSLLSPTGSILFSTRTPPEGSDINWWYIAPSSGHVSIFSEKALRLLFEGFGFYFKSVLPTLFLATRNPGLIPKG